jgi:hypothetical protein
MARMSRMAGPADDPGPTTFLVEHCWPGTTAETFLWAVKRVRTTAGRWRAAGRWIGRDDWVWGDDCLLPNSLEPVSG